MVPGGWLAALLALGRQPLGGGTNLARVEQKSAVADLTRSAPTLRNPRVTMCLWGSRRGLAMEMGAVPVKATDRCSPLLRAGGHSL